MKRLSIGVLSFCVAATMLAQAPPRLIPFSGAVTDAAGQPRPGVVVGLTFAIYEEAAGGAPLWVEAHAVELDAAGRYQVVLGSLSLDGVPVELFTRGAARWLGVQLDNGLEQPRVRLLAVPYAVAAAEAAMLGGKTAEQFVLLDSVRETVRQEVETQAENLLDPRDGAVTNATANVIPKYLNSGGTLTDSTIAEVGVNVGIGTMVPGYLLQLYSNGGHGLLQLTNTTTGGAATDGAYFGVLNGDPTFRIMNQENAGTIFFTNGTPRMTIDAAGSVGVGTTAPNYLTQVHSAAGHSLLQMTNATTGGAATDGVYFGVLAGNSTFRIINQENAPIDVFTNGAQRMTVSAAGNIGIGTAAPNYLTQLHSAGGHSLLQFTNTATGSGAADGVYFGVLNGDPTLRVMNQENAPIDFFTNGALRVSVTAAGNVGIGTASPLAPLHVAGNATVDGNIAAKYQDVAEWVEACAPIDAGTIVVIEADHHGHVRASTTAYDTTVAGAVSPQPGLLLGEAGPNKVMVAQSGRVRVKVDARYGAISAGDLLVTSPTPGHAMRSQPVVIDGTSLHRPGTLVGKAVESLESGTAEILVLLTLQ